MAPSLVVVVERPKIQYEVIEMSYQYFAHYGNAASSRSEAVHNNPSNSVEFSGNSDFPYGIRFGPIGLLLLATWLTVGCRTQPATAPPEEKTTSEIGMVQRELGPVRVRMTVSPGSARLSDELELKLTIEYPEQVDVTPPSFVEDLGSFEVRDFRDLPVTHKEDQLKLTQIYQLEPTDIGTLEIDPIPVKFVDRRSDGDGQEHQVSTDPLTVEIASQVASESPSLNDLRPSTEPIPIGTPNRWRWIRWFAIVPVAVALAYLLRLAWLRERSRGKLHLRPRERALRDLDALQHSQLAGRDVKEFFVRLTGIVRSYLEAETGVTAAEQTTEEFLRAIRDHEAFAAEARARLQDFLESADLVKFAAHHPDAMEVTNSLQRARVFITTIDGRHGEGSAENAGATERQLG